MNDREREIAEEVKEWRERNYIYDREHRLDAAKRCLNALAIVIAAGVLLWFAFVIVKLFSGN